MSPEDEGQEYKSKSTSTSIPVILDLAMNNQNNHNNIYNSNNSYPLNKITSKATARKAKWLNSSNPNDSTNININNDYIDNDQYNNDTDENRNTTKQNGHLHLNNGSIKILPKTPNGSTNNDKLYYNNNNNNNKGDENSLNSTDNYHDQQHSHNQLERRDSATNVLSPLLEKENHTSNINHHKDEYNDDFDNDENTLTNNTNTKTNTFPLHDSLPNINSTVIYNDQKDHRNNGISNGSGGGVGVGVGGGGGGGGSGGGSIDGDCDNGGWTNDKVEKNNLKNNLHRNNQHYHHNNHHHNHHHNNRQHNNNGSLTNGKNALGVDKLLNENDALADPILYKPKSTNFNDDDDGDIPDGCACNNIKFNKTSKINDYTDNCYDDDNDNKSNITLSSTSSSSCGLFGCNPKWAKNLASTHMFMVVFLLAWVCIGMFSTYFVSIITTIEKLFQIKSRTTGMLLSASELGQISTALLLTYYAGRGHRPRWIACGMVLFAIAAFACSLPHFIFGSQLMHSNNLFNGDKNSMNKSNKNIDLNLCLNPTYSTISDNLTNSIFFNTTTKLKNSDDCMEHWKEEQDSHSKITIIVMCIFFFSLLSAGIGQTAVSTLGIPYIDDNVASKESPIYLAITIGVRILGPATGFIIGSFCTRVYVDLSTPDFTASDPRWISAWWLGPVMIGTIMMFASIAMFSFPRELQGKHIKSNSSESSNGDINKSQQVIEEKPKLKDFPKTVRRQLGNSILMFRTASSVFHILPIAGLYTFLPKYLETQFRLPAADANLITAFGGILVMGIGIIISGIIILKINPSARSVAAWIAFTALMYSAGIAILMFVGCNIDDFAGLSKYTIEHETSTPTFLPSCDVECNCDFKKFSPICGIDGKTYFSSCHAGCSIAKDSKSNKTYYTDCKCIPSGFEKHNINGTSFEAVGGYCDTNCKNFILFICIFAFCVFIHSTSEVGGMLVIMRCTDPKDKAMAMGVIQSAIGLFGTVPCPIIYGAVVDSACLVWTTVCGKHGACSLYDVDNFRHYFLGITSGIMFVAFIMDVIVWSKAHRIDIAPSDAIDASLTETEFEKPINKPDTSV